MRRGLIGGLLVLASLSVAPPLWAHKFTHPKNLRLGVAHDKVLLALTYDVNPGSDSAFLRGLFDRDSSGALDAAEQGKLLGYLEQTATLWLKWWVGGELMPKVPTERIGARLELPREATEPLGLSLVYQAAAPGQDQFEVRLEDRSADARVDVPVVIDLEAGIEVVFASQGELHPKERQIQRVMLNKDAGLRLVVRRRPST